MTPWDCLKEIRSGKDICQIYLNHPKAFSKDRVFGIGKTKGELLFFDEKSSSVFLNDCGLLIKLEIKPHHHDHFRNPKGRFVQVLRVGLVNSKKNPGKKWFKILVSWFDDFYYDENRTSKIPA